MFMFIPDITISVCYYTTQFINDQIMIELWTDLCLLLFFQGSVIIR